MAKNLERIILELSAEQLERRYWSRVDKSGTASDCWNWTAHIGTAGYGRLTVKYKGLLTHRVAYTLAYGPIPDGLWVLHKCDNRSCCNPDHLFLGTTQDNTADRVRKGRSATGDRTYPVHRATGDRHWTKRHPDLIPQGESVWNAKLTKDDIIAIRKRGDDSWSSAVEIARDYGVTPQAIQAIITRKNWKHVD